MNPMCSKCSKVVYPVEKLMCLDKYWHKSCFKCEVCNLALNMKTYKGYNKKPYCNIHYPTTKHTVVADTPENLRLAAQTKKQTNIKYNKDSEKNKAKVNVDSDPEVERIKKMASKMSDSDSVPPSDNQPPLGMDPLVEPAPAPSTPIPGKRYRAIYDYAAADDDEASFIEGDVILDVEQVDEGFMTGCVERTGMSGLFPDNYVEPI